MSKDKTPDINFDKVFSAANALPVSENKKVQGWIDRVTEFLEKAKKGGLIESFGDVEVHRYNDGKIDYFIPIQSVGYTKRMEHAETRNPNVKRRKRDATLQITDDKKTGRLSIGLRSLVGSGFLFFTVKDSENVETTPQYNSEVENFVPKSISTEDMFVPFTSRLIEIKDHHQAKMRKMGIDTKPESPKPLGLG